METFLGEKEEKKGLNKGFIIGIAVGVVLIAAAIWLMSFRPSVDDQKAQILEGLFREGSPEFAEVTKDIVISTDDRTVESPNGFGAISMFIVGKVRNKGTKTISALEVNVSVIDQANAVVKEKRVLVVPAQREKLNPGEIIPITLSLDGFDKQDDRANIRWKVTGLRTEN
ncbi:MAG: hypothetical protein ABIU09_07870 [Pyrinomonadaceae bacterium]